MPSEYNSEWWQTVYLCKYNIKFMCERCGHHEDEEAKDYLTGIVLDYRLPYYKPGNLAVLCKSCRRYIINTTLDSLVNQLEMFGDFELHWLEPHLKALGIPGPMMEGA